MNEFREGELVIYRNGDHFEVGKIKRLMDTGAFVWYHEGETAAKTPYENMHKIQNAYVVKETSLGGADGRGVCPGGCQRSYANPWRYCDECELKKEMEL